MRWTPRGVSDSVDGSNSFPGAMSLLQNLIPSPTTAGCWVPRPASTKLTDFTGLDAATKGPVNALLQIGNVAYGMIAETSGAFNGKDVPFSFNVVTKAFNTITIPGGAASLPATPSATGDWTPPTMAQVGSRVIITHPGYAGGASPFFGWLDLSGLNSATATGNTHSNTTVDTLSVNVLTLGWQPGDLISDSAGDIPANTTIVSIASGGLSLVLSQAATGTHTTTTFTVTGGTAAAPLYGSGNTNLNVLKAVPVAVFNFNGRAYYAVPGNGAQFSDSLVPCQITNPTQQLIPGNGVDFTAWGGLAVSQTLGGILQALIGFQGDTQMQQITGDPALTSGLQMNFIGLGVGTLAPLTICQCPEGLAFVSSDGLRIINYVGQVSEPIGANGEGVCNPFISVINPTRMAAAFNNNVLRISVQNGATANQAFQEWWFDFKLKVWSGPHSFPATIIVPFQGTPGHGFTMSAIGVSSALWSSAVTVSLADTYTENGVPLTFEYQTVLLPDTQGMSMNKMVLAMLAAALPRNQTWQVIALDESGGVIDQISLTGPSQADTLWGSFTWGASPWGGTGTYLYQHPLAWNLALIFKQMGIQVSGNSALGMVIGNLNTQIEELGYLTQRTG